MLDPTPDNQLGKGILPTALEASLLAKGYVYARRFTRNGITGLVTSKRPLADVARSWAEDAARRHFAAPLPTKRKTKSAPVGG